MNNTTFSATISESSRELTPYETVKFKDTANALKIDELTQEDEKVVIAPKGYVVLDIHNEKSDNPDYKNFIIFDGLGTKYVTGSQAFWNTFINIWNDMKDFDEDWEIELLRKPSKNFKGKDFITCALV